VKSKEIIGVHFSTLFSAIFLSLMFLNTQIDWIILKAYDQQFTLTKNRCISSLRANLKKNFPKGFTTSQNHVVCKFREIWLTGNRQGHASFT